MSNPLPQKLSPFIGHFLKPYKRAAMLFVCVALLCGCWGPFNSLLVKHIINLLTVHHENSISFLQWPAMLLVLNFIVFDNVTWRTIAYLNYKYQPLIKNKIIHECFQYILGASQQYFHDTLSGRISSQINILADNIERVLHRILPDFIRGFSLVLIAFMGSYYVNPKFFLVMAIWFIAFSSYSVFMSHRLVELSDMHTESESVVSGELVDSISNVSHVVIFARRLFEVLRLDKFLFATREAFQAKDWFILKLHSIQGAMIAIMLGFMCYYLIRLYDQHLISIGDFALILGLTMEVGHMTWYTMSQVDEFNQAVGKCKQSLASLMVQQDIKDKMNAPDLQVTKGQITFSDVKFNYESTEPLFQNKSITIEAGQKVGLVGYSGGGKSTFVNLILRLFDVADGRILIDGQDVRDVSQESLRKNIGLIPQDPSLFHRTLMANIRYGCLDATDDEVMTAAQKAHAHEFITKLPLGYESPVGERGVKLSGGQRQRIAIARAILKNAPILILDEATSQLDSITETDIQDSLWQLMQNKTTIVIAHRLSTLLHMDRIMVFDHGQIVEEGTHTQLLSQNGLYTKLWQAQVGGFMLD